MAVYEGDWKLIAVFKRGQGKPKSFAEPVEPVALFDLTRNVKEDEAGNLVLEPSQQERVRRMLTLFEQMRGTAGKGRTTPTRRTPAALQ